MDRTGSRGVEYNLVDEKGNLDRPLRAEPWYVPGLQLVDGRLTVDPLWWPGRLVRPKPPILEAFAQLGAPGRDHARLVRAFARRWGPLNLCQHQLPLGHDEVDAPLSFATTGLARITVRPSEPCRQLAIYEGEPIAAWVYWSRQAAAILAVASRLREGSRARAGDWASLGEEGPWVADDLDADDFRRQAAEQWVQSLVRGYPSNESTETARAVRSKVERSVVTGAIEAWLRLAGVAVELRWPEGAVPSIGFRINGLFGSLGVQLLLAAADSPGFDSCAGCGRVIARVRRRGRPGRYCADCIKRNRPQQLADKRRALKLALKKDEAKSGGQTASSPRVADHKRETGSRNP